MTRNIAECIESVEFSTFFSLNILLFSQVHIMKSYVEKTIDDLSEDLGRPVTLWLMAHLPRGYDPQQLLHAQVGKYSNTILLLSMILINHDRLGTDWHLDASMNFKNLFHHFLGCGELPEYGVSDDDYGPLPPPSPSLTPEIKAIVGELLISIKERVIGYPILKHDKSLHTFGEEDEQTE